MNQEEQVFDSRIYRFPDGERLDLAGARRRRRQIWRIAGAVVADAAAVVLVWLAVWLSVCP